ncbi:hypothetical protein [Streptomyces sp. NPDC093225]|uniref:hypothetical protein n=1 Tax=Streptomyces sp. NPDC093225 TaxID=3366034 RepID=UPI00380F3B05
MDEEAMADALRWLAEEGVTRVGDDEWTDGRTPGERITGSDVAVRFADLVFTDERLAPEGQLRLAFGLLDLLDAYWVTCEMGTAFADPDFGLPAEGLWNGYRQRLEAPGIGAAVTYSLWVDWFEDRRTSAEAFDQVLGRDVARLRAGAPEALLRRAARVLECSGPVPWEVKERSYRAAARLPELHPALFKGLLDGYTAVYGDLDPAAALALLTSLSLPPDTEHLTALRTVLTAGHRNHRHSPHAWRAACAGASGSVPDRPPA